MFIEVSPHPVLTAGSRRPLDSTARPGRRSLRRDDGGPAQFLTPLAEAFTGGVAVDWRPRPAAARAELPGYAFQRQRYWPAPFAPRRPAAGRGGRRVLGRRRARDAGAGPASSVHEDAAELAAALPCWRPGGSAVTRAAARPLALPGQPDRLADPDERLPDLAGRRPRERRRARRPRARRGLAGRGATMRTVTVTRPRTAGTRGAADRPPADPALPGCLALAASPRRAALRRGLSRAPPRPWP